MSEQSHIFVGRQPILDRDQNVVAYELLFRASASASDAVYAEQGAASLRVIVNAFMTMGLDRVLGRHLGFLNVVGSMIKSDLIEALPQDENVEIDESLTRRLGELDRMGFALALDDWIQDDYRAEMLDLARYVKLDLVEIPRPQWRKVVRKLRQQKQDVLLLAEKVETREEFELCLSLGFDLFQGYFFSTPQVLEGDKIDPARIEVLDLIRKLMGERENREIAEVLKRNPSLSMNLLRLVNSAALSPSSKISQIEDALVYLGRDNLRRWLFMLLYAGDCEGAVDDPLLQTATHRGRLMELIAGELVEGPANSKQTESAFLVGMLSMIDVLLGQPIEEVVPGLSLTDEVQAAILKREGTLGRLLTLAVQIEREDFDTVSSTAAEFALEIATLQDCDNRAYAWVHGLAQPAS